MNSVCWNCHAEGLAESDAFCSACGQPRNPSPAQVITLRGHIEFLLAEASGWTQAPAEWRESLLASYRERLVRLSQWGEELSVPPPSEAVEPAADKPLPRWKQLRSTSAGVSQAWADEVARQAHLAPHPSVPAEAQATSFAPADPRLIAAEAPPEQHAISSEAHTASSVSAEADAAASIEADPGELSPSTAEIQQGSRADGGSIANVQEATGRGNSTAWPDDAIQSGPEREASAPSAPGEFRELLAESNIRWVHGLGALLLVSAAVGYLRLQWDGVGRQIVALALTLTPAVFFAAARALHERLPLSSRLLATIGGIMLPMGLLSLNHFHVFGLQLPPSTWTPISFGVSSLVLAGLSFTLRESACLYLAAATWMLAFATTGSGLLLGLVAFASAAACLQVGWRDQASWRSPHLLKISQLLAGVGLVSGLIRLPSPDSAATALLVGAVFYAAFAFQSGESSALLLSSLAALGGAWAGTHQFHLPTSTLGLTVMLQGALYLARSRRSDAALAFPSFTLGTALTGGVLLLVLGGPLFHHVWNNFAGMPRAELLTCTLTGALATLFYAVVAGLFARPLWLYASAACFIYTYFLTVVLLGVGSGSYSALLVTCALGWEVACLALRRRVPAAYLTPWIWSGALLAGMLTPVNAMLGSLGGNSLPLACGNVALLLVWLAAAAWSRRPELLYPASAAVVMAYGSWLQVLAPIPEHPNYGLSALPLAAMLGLAGLATERQVGRRFATPLAQAAGAVATLALASQAFQAWGGFSGGVALCWTLGCLGLAVAGWLYRDWTWLAAPAGQTCRSLAFLCLLGAVAAWGNFSLAGWQAALVVCAGGVLASAEVSAAGLAFCAMLAVFGPGAVKLWPALIWMASALHRRSSEAMARQLSVAATALGWLAVMDQPQMLPDLAYPLVLSAGLVISSWRGADPVQAVCAFTFLFGATLFCSFNWFPSWWLLQAGLLLWLVAAHRADRSPLLAALRPLNGLVAVVSLVSALTLGSSWGSAHCGLNAVALLVAAVAMRSRPAFLGGSCLVALGLTQVAQLLQVPREWLGVAFALLAVVQLGAAAALPWCAEAALKLAPCLTLAVLFCCLGGPPVVNLASGLSALVWGWRARLAHGADMRPSGPENYWGSFVFLYLCWWNAAGTLGLSAIEWYTVPWGLWMLLWADRFAPAEDARAARRTGLITLLAPSLTLSLLVGSDHTLWSGALGFALLFARRGVYFTAGSIALMLEVTIQALAVAAHFSWPMWASLGGITLVSLGISFDRQRTAWQAAGVRLLERLSEL